MKRFLSSLVIVLAVLGTAGCETVDRTIGVVFGDKSDIAAAINTPLKQWAITQQGLSAATDAAAGAIEQGFVPIEIARKIATFQGDAQSALDEAFEVITSSKEKTSTGLTWQEALAIAKTKTASINGLLEVFK